MLDRNRLHLHLRSQVLKQDANGYNRWKVVTVSSALIRRHLLTTLMVARTRAVVSSLELPAPRH